MGDGNAMACKSQNNAQSDAGAGLGTLVDVDGGLKSIPELTPIDRVNKPPSYCSG